MKLKVEAGAGGLGLRWLGLGFRVGWKKRDW